MAVTPAQIRELREISGAGMTDCKKALEQNDGDIQKAVVFLREKGLATAAKKAGRIAAEGLVIAASKDGVGAIMEINCETDFVAQNPVFKQFADNVLDIILTKNVSEGDLLDEAWTYDDSAATVGDALKGKIALYGENIGIRRFQKIENSSLLLKTYIHGGGRVAVLVGLETDKKTEAIDDAAKNICLQIAFSRPMYVAQSDIDPEFITSEKDIIKEQTKNDEKAQGKPEAVVEKMVEGRLAKRLKEVCLLDQEYVKDGELTVGKYIEKVGKEEGAKISIAKFAVYEKGEGIAKKEENFADEVSKMMGQ